MNYTNYKQNLSIYYGYIFPSIIYATRMDKRERERERERMKYILHKY